MRNGALTTGKNTCSSSPVDILGTQLVLPKVERFCEKSGKSFELPGFCPPTQLKVIGSCAGQPKTVPLIRFCSEELIRSCEFLRMGSMPTSMNGASATGPAMVMRYSKLVTKLASPPGKTICSTGTGMV